ncbi:MAG: hypothetical protein M5U28_10120 [Sandaracinaceae bacterium]|nr:hypothetical protein [Sandaracinaceae bacterium]
MMRGEGERLAGLDQRFAPRAEGEREPARDAARHRGVGALEHHAAAAHHAGGDAQRGLGRIGPGHARRELGAERARPLGLAREGRLEGARERGRELVVVGRRHTRSICGRAPLPRRAGAGYVGCGDRAPDLE